MKIVTIEESGPHSAHRDRWRWFLLTALVLVAVRMLVVVTEEPEGGNQEALISGRLAFDLLNGSWRGWYTYVYYTVGHLGNEVAVSLLAVPLFSLFGTSLLVISLIPIAASVLIVALLYTLAHSQRAALLASLYFVLVPIAVHRWLANPYFSHMESSLFFLASLWLLRPVWEAGGAAVHWSRPFAAGGAAGIGIVLCDTQWVALASILAAWALCRRSKLGAGSFAAGFVIGMLPYLAYFYYRPALASHFFDSMLGDLYHSVVGVAASGPQLPLQVTYTESIARFAEVFWPIGNFASSLEARALAGLAGVLAVAWYAMRSLETIREKPLEFAILCFVCIFTSIHLLMRSTTNYYLYAVLPPLSLLVGNAASVRDLRVRVARWSVSAAPVVLVLAAAVSFVPSMWKIQPSRLSDQWQAVQQARGYAFFSFPFDRYGVYSGYKTPLGQDVEKWVTRMTPMEPTSNLGNEKGFVNALAAVSHRLSSESDYYLFGMQVTNLSIPALSDLILEQVPESFLDEAFGSMAVFAANDLLLSDLLQTFEDGTIDSSIPPAYAHYFYSELGRKIKDRGAEARPSVRALMAAMSKDQRGWFERGMLEARYVDYQIPVIPLPRWNGWRNLN